MAFDKNKKEEVARHEWDGSWNVQDYARHVSELTKLKVEFNQCVSEWEISDRKGKNKHPHFIFQYKNAGVDTEGNVIHRSGDTHQRFDINVWKLEKLDKWVAINQTEEESLNSLSRASQAIESINLTFDKCKTER